MAENDTLTQPQGETQQTLDTRDQLIADLQEQLRQAQADVVELDRQLASTDKLLADQKKRAADLERKLKDNKAAPTGDVVYLGGQSWPVKGTVKAKFASEEVRRGHVPEDVTLVVIDRIE